MLKVIWNIFLNATPIILMIALIPFVENDTYLLSAYVITIVVAFILYYEKKDYIYFIFGLIVITIFEYFFVSTGVETFNRQSLLGVMPIWLPILWAYAFVVIKRSIIILEKYLS